MEFVTILCVIFQDSLLQNILREWFEQICTQKLETCDLHFQTVADTEVIGLKTLLNVGYCCEP